MRVSITLTIKLAQVKKYSIILMFLSINCLLGCTESLLKDRIRAQNFKGIIEANYVDSSDRMASIIIVKGKKYNTHSDAMITYAKAGDSISKRQGDLFYTVISIDSTRQIYPDIAGKLLTE